MLDTLVQQFSLARGFQLILKVVQSILADFPDLSFIYLRQPPNGLGSVLCRNTLIADHFNLFVEVRKFYIAGHSVKLI